MPDEIVELSEFPDEASAWLARAVLESNGIPSQVITDPPYAHPWPRVRLAVREKDAQAAARLLNPVLEGPRE
jgi:hypothetical protein